MGIGSAISKWWARPLDTEGSVLNWFLFFGLIILISFVWAKLIRGYQAIV